MFFKNLFGQFDEFLPPRIILGKFLFLNELLKGKNIFVD